MSIDLRSPRLPTVLCVDDDLGVLKALERLLRAFDCKVLTTTDGGEALDILEKEEVDVLICDARMPVMDGIEVLRQAAMIAPATVSILLTAHASDQDVVIPAVNEGEIFRLLPKPWDDDELRRAVADALGMEPEAWMERQRSVRSRLDGSDQAA